MLTDPKKIGARLEKCAKRMGIRQSKDAATSNIPYGIDQSTLSKWYKGIIPKPQFSAFCCHIGMSFDDIPEKSAEKYIPPNVEPKDAKLLESIIADLVTLEGRGYPMQVTATQLKSVLIQVEPAPVPAEERMLEGFGTPELALILSGLHKQLGATDAGTPAYLECIRVLQTVAQLSGQKIAMNPVQVSETVKSPAPVDEKSS